MKNSNAKNRARMFERMEAMSNAKPFLKALCERGLKVAEIKKELTENGYSSSVYDYWRDRNLSCIANKNKNTGE